MATEFKLSGNDLMADLLKGFHILKELYLKASPIFLYTYCVLRQAVFTGASIP